MVPFIYTARDTYGTTSVQAYRDHHAAAIAKRQQKGAREVVHDVTDAVEAYVNENRWLIDCECGAGNMVEPDLRLACCYACGAVHTQVVVPDDRAHIEAVLVTRKKPMTRGWRDQRKDETLADLVAENTARSIPVPAQVIAEVAQRSQRGDR